jgi:hypothetical protein
MAMDNLKEEFNRRREKLLSEKTDVTKWMVDYVSDYIANLKK